MAVLELLGHDTKPVINIYKIVWNQTNAANLVFFSDLHLKTNKKLVPTNEGEQLIMKVIYVFFVLTSVIGSLYFGLLKCCCVNFGH